MWVYQAVGQLHFLVREHKNGKATVTIRQNRNHPDFSEINKNWVSPCDLLVYKTLLQGVSETLVNKRIADEGPSLAERCLQLAVQKKYTLSTDAHKDKTSNFQISTWLHTHHLLTEESLKSKTNFKVTCEGLN